MKTILSQGIPYPYPIDRVLNEYLPELSLLLTVLDWLPPWPHYHDDHDLVVFALLTWDLRLVTTHGQGLASGRLGCSTAAAVDTGTLAGVGWYCMKGL